MRVFVFIDVDGDVAQVLRAPDGAPDPPTRRGYTTVEINQAQLVEYQTARGGGVRVQMKNLNSKKFTTRTLYNREKGIDDVLDPNDPYDPLDPTKAAALEARWP